jgi:hypothetical protein
MKYLNASFTMATCTTPMTQLEYDLAVGKISQEEFETLSGKVETVNSSTAA